MKTTSMLVGFICALLLAIRSDGEVVLFRGTIRQAGSNTGLLSTSGWSCNVFASGQGGYHTYRIPALAVTTNGTVLAFCEGRRKSASDTGEIDLLLKRSTDHGTNWSEPTVIWHDASNTCGNPCALVDTQTRTIFLLATWNLGVSKRLLPRPAKTHGGCSFCGPLMMG